MAQQWYYADRQRQQRGPVAADELVAALRRGDVDMSTLVWHERLPGWVPLAQVAAELGVQGAPPPVPRSAPGPRAAPRSGGGGRTVLIVVGVLLGCLVVFGGIFAAIAIPAYSEYSVRTRINQAYIVASSERIAVAEFYMTNERCPVNGDEGFGPAEGYSGQYLSGLEFGPGPDGCEIRAKLQGLNQPRLGDAQLTLNLDRNHNWTSTANIPNRYLPTAMRR